MRRPVFLEPRAQPIDPEPPIGVEHDLDNAGILQVGGDVWPERGA
jgi:hypothetical protein